MSLATREFEDTPVTADNRQSPINPLNKISSVNREPSKQLITIHSYLRSHGCGKQSRE